MAEDLASEERVQTAGGATAFERWFAGSAVARGGQPLVVYHATDARFHRFQYTEDIGFHFGPLAAAQARVAQCEMDDPVFMAVYLAIRRPLRLPDLFTWSPTSVASCLADASVITQEQAESADVVDREQVLEWLERAGYDGIVYANAVEGGGDCYIAMRPEQIKSATHNQGSYCGECADIRHAVAPPPRPRSR